jgi:hypothetical protein
MFCVFPYQFLFSPLRLCHTSNQPYSPFLLVAATHTFAKAYKSAVGLIYQVFKQIVPIKRFDL